MSAMVRATDADLPVQRHAAEFLTIAHISDLHFRAVGTDGRDANASLRDLGRELKSQGVDAICVTGDVADNPIAHPLSMLGDRLRLYRQEARMRNLLKPLHGAYVLANEYFRQWCSDAGIDGARCLFVIPGNHDLRPQGFLGNHRIGAHLYSMKADEVFRQAFSGLYKNSDILFIHPNGPEISARIVCLSSNDEQPLLNFARGGLSEDALLKFQADMGAGRARVAEPGGEDFGVCLVHHHPLPISGAEVAPAGNNAVHGPNVLRRLARLVRKGMAGGKLPELELDQTTAFINPGMFLSAAMQHHTNLILHGHQHRSFFRVLEHAQADTIRRMLIVGAGSLGQPEGGKCQYNLIRLFANGNIEVRDRQRELHEGTQFFSGPPLLSMDKHRLRIYRYESRRRHFVGESPSSSVLGQHDRATATSVSRVFRLDMHGGAEVTLTFHRLSPVGEELNLLRLQSVNSANAFDMESRSIKVDWMDGPGPTWQESKGELMCEVLEDGDQRSTIQLKFAPPLKRDQSVTVIVKYRLRRTFEYIRSGPEAPPEEFIYARCTAIFPERLHKVIVFPANWRPKGRLRVHVHDRQGREDREEQQFAQQKLLYLEQEGVVTLTLDRPLPGLYYGILWPKDMGAGIPEDENWIATG